MVTDRKGEHLEISRGAARPGVSYARASTARSHELDALPKLDAQAEAHHRGRDRPFAHRARRPGAAHCRSRSKLRSAQRRSWRGAHTQLDEEPESEKSSCSRTAMACPICGYSLPELEPRLFSFNNPVGACPTCDGVRGQGVLRPATRRGPSAPESRGWRGARLGSSRTRITSS